MFYVKKTILLFFVVCFFAISLNACGKRGNPVSPTPNYPRTYP